MERDRDEERREGPGCREPRRDRGSDAHGFLDLEIGKVLASDASKLGRRALEELLLERVKAKLKDRLAERIEELARFAADDLVADLEANIEIEQRIEARRQLRERQSAELAERLSGPARRDPEGGDDSA
jgi:hypothetical protein